jgi:hypothetical protein
VLQAQLPHVHVLVHVWLPLTSHACVAPAAHKAAPVHADQTDHVPLLHVRVWLPQLPHACDDGPEQVHWPLWHMEPVGHALPHAPQLFASLVVSTHAVPHIVAAHVATHCAAEASPVDVSHIVPLVQALPHEPQLLAVLSAVSQPFAGSLSQLP